MIVARTDADAADMLISDADERDHEFLTGERTAEGFFRSNAGIEQAIARGIAYAPYADLVWCETAEPDMEQAERFARELHDAHPGKLLAYNCSPSFNWKGKLDDDEIAGFQERLGELGYVFQFITLAGFHTLNHSMFELARGYREHGMTAYAELQQREFANEDAGYTAVKHQHEVGASYFEEVAMAITGGESETTSVARLHRGGPVQPVGRALTRRARQDSNLRPRAPEARALSTELRALGAASLAPRGPRGDLRHAHAARRPAAAGRVRRAAAGADAILHAGDLMELEVLEALQSARPAGARRARERGQLGVDRPAPAACGRSNAGGVRIGMVHDAGPGDRAARPACAAASRTRDAVVFGHSHIPLHETAATAFRSSTPARRPSAGARRSTRWASRRSRATR